MEGWGVMFMGRELTGRIGLGCGLRWVGVYIGRYEVLKPNRYIVAGLLVFSYQNIA